MDLSSLTSANQTIAAMDIYKSKSVTDAFSRDMAALSESGDDTELLKACRDFESYFVQQILKQMRQTSDILNPDSLFGKSQAEKMFTEMHDEEVAKSAAESGGIGLAAFLYKQLKRENQSAEEPGAAAAPYAL